MIPESIDSKKLFELQHLLPTPLAVPLRKWLLTEDRADQGIVLLDYFHRLVRFLTAVLISENNEDEVILNRLKILNCLTMKEYTELLNELVFYLKAKEKNKFSEDLVNAIGLNPDFFNSVKIINQVYERWTSCDYLNADAHPEIETDVDEVETNILSMIVQIDYFKRYSLLSPVVDEEGREKWLIWRGMSNLPPVMKGRITKPGAMDHVYFYREGYEKLLLLTPFMIALDIKPERGTDFLMYHEFCDGEITLYEDLNSGFLRESEREIDLNHFHSAGRIMGKLCFSERKKYKETGTLKEIFALKGMHESLIGLTLAEVISASEPKLKFDALIKLHEALKSAEQIEFDRIIRRKIYDNSKSLEREYRTRENFDSLAAVLLDRVEFIEDSSEKFADLIILSKLFTEKLQNMELAFPCLLKALEIRPSDSDLLKEIEKTASQLNKWSELKDVYEGFADRVPKIEGAKMLFRAGKIYMVKLKDMENAEKSLTKALINDPADIEALKFLIELYKETGQPQKAVESAFRLKEFDITMDERLNILKMIGSMLISLEKKEDALKVFREIHELKPSDNETLKILAELLIEKESLEELEKIYSKSLERIVDPVMRAYLLKSVAELRHKLLENLEGACEAYEKLLEIEPYHAEALDFLESYFSVRQDFRNLIEILYRASSQPEKKKAKLLQIAKIYRENLKDNNASLGVYRRVNSDFPHDNESFKNIKEIMSEQKMWNELIELLDERIKTAPKEEWGLILCEKGKILHQKLNMLQESREALTKSLEMDLLNTEAGEELKLILSKLKDWEGLARVLQAEEPLKENDEEKCSVLFEIGRIYQEKLDRMNDAIMFYEKALQHDPAHYQTSCNLSSLYLMKEEFSKAIPLLENAIYKIEKEGLEGNPAELHMNIANAALKIADREKAVVEFSKVVELDSSRFDIRATLADILIEEGEFKKAEPHYLNIIENFKDAAPLDTLFNAYYNLGVIAIEKHDSFSALKYFENAHGLKKEEPDPELLKKMAKAAVNLEDFGKAVEYFEKLLACESNELEKFTIHMKLGDLLKEKLNSREKALKHYKAAKELKKDSKAVLHKTLEIAAQIEDHLLAKDTLIEIIELEQDPKKKASLFYTAALMCYQNLKNDELGIEYLKQSIFYDPDHKEASKLLEEIYINREDYQALVAHFLNALTTTRSRGDRLGEADLLERIIDIYSQKLNNTPLVIQYLEELSLLKPDDEDLMKRLSELYKNTAELAPKAREMYRKMLRKNLKNTDAVRAMRDIFEKKNDRDAVWCLNGVLASMEMATDDEKKAFEQYRTGALKIRKEGITGDLVTKYIKSDEEDELICNVFIYIYKVIKESYPWRNLVDFGIADQMELNLKSKELFQSIYHAVEKIYNIQAPKVYLAKNSTGVLKIPVNPPVLAIGPDVLKEKKGKELRFILGKMMYYFLPGHAVAGIMDIRVLKSLFIGALKGVFPELPLDDTAAESKLVINLLRAKLTGEEYDSMTSLLTRFRNERKEINLGKWLRGIELSANHAGLFLANDPVIASEMMKIEPFPLSSLTADEKKNELVYYAMDDRYFELRKLSGIAVQ
jgi:tetratricopeptide (TPR) repeat protein